MRQTVTRVLMDKKAQSDGAIAGIPTVSQRRLHASHAAQCRMQTIASAGAYPMRIIELCTVRSVIESVSLMAVGFISAPATTGESVPGLQSRPGS